MLENKQNPAPVIKLMLQQVKNTIFTDTSKLQLFWHFFFPRFQENIVEFAFSAAFSVATICIFSWSLRNVFQGLSLNALLPEWIQLIFIWKNN